MVIYQVQCQKVLHAQGEAGAELKLKEQLELSKFKQWKQATRVAARALGGINRE